MNFARARLNQGLIVAKILLRHPPGGKPFVELHPHLTSAEVRKSSDRRNSFRFSRHDKASYSVVDDLRHRAGLEGNDGRAAGHRLDHDETERFWPIDRKQ